MVLKLLRSITAKIKRGRFRNETERNSRILKAVRDEKSTVAWIC
jgi:hypothetical protein